MRPEERKQAGGNYDLTTQDKVISLFEYIKALGALRQKAILQVAEYEWWRGIAALPEDPDNIEVFYRDRVEEDPSEDETDSAVLLSVHRPELQSGPEPAPQLAEWLYAGWDDFRQKAKTKPFLLRSLEQVSPSCRLPERVDEQRGTYRELFADDAKRVAAYEAWQGQRQAWAEQQKLLEQTRDLFAELYQICIDLERDSATLELVVADGFLRDRENPDIELPILTRRVKIRHDSVENTIYIEDTDTESGLETTIFQSLEGLNLAALNRLRDDLHENDYHPLDRNDLPLFFASLAHQLTSDSQYAPEGLPSNWQKKERIWIYRNPCYILRKRSDGAQKAIEQIIANVQETGQVPAPIRDIVDGGEIEIPEDTGEISIEEQLAAVGGESVDILLSKEANKEQLEIARRIERYNAVLVQGPPGTGKTHTIANLMGHFLAQGKSILVTSHTKKALSVLKEKLVPGIQSLCVSVLDDSNTDMERSIDGITERMSGTTSFEMKKEMDTLGVERKEIIRQLAEVRKRLFAVIHQECDCIVYNGKSISPSAAAAFVQEHSETLSYIPGKVRLYEPPPLSLRELAELYRSNGGLTLEDEAEFKHNLPKPSEVMAPADFEAHCNALAAGEVRLSVISNQHQWEIQNLPAEQKLLVTGSFGLLTLAYPESAAVEQLTQYLAAFPQIEPWMQQCAADGRRGGSYRTCWARLIEEIQQTCALAEQVAAEKFGKRVEITSTSPDFRNAMQQLQSKYAQGGKVSKFPFLRNKKLEMALNGATVNEHQPETAEDCALILHIMELEARRKQCASCWDDSMAKYGAPRFFELDSCDPEQIAVNYIPLIQRNLDWFSNEYTMLRQRMNDVGLPCNVIFQENALDSPLVITEKVLSAVAEVLPGLCQAFSVVVSTADLRQKLQKNRTLLQIGNRVSSRVCRALLEAMEAGDAATYREAYAALEDTYTKRDLKGKREAYLARLAPAAPQWAEAIASRAGIHGNVAVPADVEDAWMWKQYYGIIQEILAEPYGQLQEKSISLSKEYRRTTALYAEKSAWYHLLLTTEGNTSLRQSLQGWKQTVKKIGKGTGKNAPRYRAKARAEMAKCQMAVPAWIMPIGKALESLNPQTNQFDIVIVDEASQSDISSLAILYMGKKLIIVGDDKQVSPMAIGMQVDQINHLQEMHLSNKIPNAHLYDSKTSIYDIAATTFQPLMLREHFRCVPEIIQFSNYLSYDFKIKPLRDSSSSKLLPAVVNYRVQNGERIGKTNPNEAKAIIALLQACMEQPEYAGKTFGIISMLGEEQVKKIQEELYKNIDLKECTQRKILCGNAANFQGDERDVIFLSLVDSASGDGPLAKRSFGVDDSDRKRYNVAASRAKDQLWVVDSLDPASDLKSGDLRKMLIDFSLNPQSINIQNAKIEEQADSPFEAAVARYLTVRGYHLVQQWEVGAYRLDLVALCREKKIAIECDGERYHSGEDQIRADMERQTILERLGWRFIRIRGSEYYRNPEQTMERVVAELTKAGIAPEAADSDPETTHNRETELLQRVKRRAYAILHHGEEEPTINPATVAAALASTPTVPEAELPEPKAPQVPSAEPKVALSAVLETKQQTAYVEEKRIQQPAAAIPSKPASVPEAQLRLQGLSTTKPKAAPKTPPKTKPKTVPAKKSKPDAKQPEMEQLGLFDDSEPQPQADEILSLLENAGVPYVDKREKGGALWMIGGPELSEIAKKAKALGYNFTYKKEGGQATRRTPGWWGR